MFADPDFSQVLIWARCKSLGNVTAGIQGWPWEEWDHGMDERGRNILGAGVSQKPGWSSLGQGKIPDRATGWALRSLPSHSGILGFMPHARM